MSFQIKKNQQRTLLSPYEIADLAKLRQLLRLPLAMPLDRDLLLKRIKAGGFTSRYLGDAFMSAYQRTPFGHSLGVITEFDNESYRLFFQVLMIRSVLKWNDADLSDLDSDIRIIMANLSQQAESEQNKA